MQFVWTDGVVAVSIEAAQQITGNADFSAVAGQREIIAASAHVNMQPLFYQTQVFVEMTTEIGEPSSIARFERDFESHSRLSAGTGVQSVLAAVLPFKSLTASVPQSSGREKAI